MKAVPAWKKWLSYLTELHIESAPSSHNPHLYVSLHRGRYQLSTANAIYSYEDLYTNFRYAFRQIRLEALPGKDLLLLGLGLGSVPLMLEKVFEQRFRYTAVELDPNVIELAQRYILSELASPILTICADAHSFVMQQEEQYSLICMDVFLDDVIPAAFQGTEYLNALKEALAPGGLLLYNCLYRNPADKQQTEKFFRERFRKVFPRSTPLNVDGNWILVSEERLVKSKG